jgi:hypothetical protein
LKNELFGTPNFSPILSGLSKSYSADEIIKDLFQECRFLMIVQVFGRLRIEAFSKRTVPEDEAPDEDPKSARRLGFDAAEVTLLKAEIGSEAASDDRRLLKTQSVFGTRNMFGRLEMPPEEFERTTAGFKAAIAISEEKNLKILETKVSEDQTEVSEDQTEVFEEQPLPELSAKSKRKKISGPSIRSGEFRKDEPRTPLDVKRTNETLDDRQPLPEAFSEDDDEPEARREEQNSTEHVKCSERKNSEDCDEPIAPDDMKEDDQNSEVYSAPEDDRTRGEGGGVSRSKEGVRGAWRNFQGQTEEDLLAVPCSAACPQSADVQHHRRHRSASLLKFRTSRMRNSKRVTNI